MASPPTTHGDAFWYPVNEGGKRRLRQIARYLMAHWPTPYPTRLRFERIADQHQRTAETYRYCKRLVIRIDPRACFSWACETLLHEWAHAATWPGNPDHEAAQDAAGCPDHSPDWGAIHTAIIHQIDDLGGLEDSKSW